ncbi:MAG: phospholipid carrier-dependent glycosyltransferase [Chloroflexota bacterium]|nr:MAG: phospholipid carrier-dependent glycosyltransferase [Chloroflexota bacterium]
MLCAFANQDVSMLLSRIAPVYRRDVPRVALFALLIGASAAALIDHPGYTDAFYYYNAAQRMANGLGMTDANIWTYIGAPAGLPIPSHLYWQPLSSIIAFGGLSLFGIHFGAAQIAFLPLYALIAVLSYALGALLGKSRRVAWLAALLTIFSGYYFPYWFTTSTIAPFGAFGALSLLSMGIGRKRRAWAWFILSGACAALAHLTRSDGLLLLIVMLIVALWRTPLRSGVPMALAGALAYTALMAPWWLRTLALTGTPLPVGGLETAFMRSYDEIANYPPQISLSHFLDWGLENILESRLRALGINLMRFVGEQGMIVLVPLMLLSAWRKRMEPILSGFLLYAPLLFGLMTLVFALPGARGGLFHSGAALLPFWAALGAVGLQDVLIEAAQQRRWRLSQAKIVFGGALAAWAISLSLMVFANKRADWNHSGAFYQALSLPSEAIAMINDPPALYYFTGIMSVVLPNAPPSSISDLAARYGVTHVVLDRNHTKPMETLWRRQDVPFFLDHLYYDGKVRIYRVRTQGASREVN